MVPWRSRWSWLRLVNAAAAKRVPSTRCIARPWLDTSIATTSTPAVAELGQPGLQRRGVGGRRGRSPGCP